MKKDLPVYKKVLFVLGVMLLLHTALFLIGGTAASVTSFVYRTTVTPIEGTTEEKQYVCGDIDGLDIRRACSLEDVLTEDVFEAFWVVLPIFLSYLLFALKGPVLAWGVILNIPFDSTFLNSIPPLLFVVVCLIVYFYFLGRYWYKHPTDAKREKWRIFLIQLGVIVLLTAPIWAWVIYVMIFGL